MSAGPTIVALVPARAGSRRVPGKNVRPLAGHPLIAYTIAAARASGVFDAVVVSTDSPAYAALARHYGAETPFLRPAALAGATSPDIGWVRHALAALAERGRRYECFAILRPTSPFRTAATIRRAWAEFRAEAGVDSLRAVEPVAQHPGKMWIVRGRRMLPLLPFAPDGVPWHSRQYQDLPAVHVQNASLEIAWTRVALEGGSIAGEVVMPFHTEGLEGFDINTPQDWWYAEHLVASGEARLPEVGRPPLFLEDVAAEPAGEGGA
ncbi:MAG TPA: acylneuraminate cytidylyltransferase family protein [Chromatiales bacterium]|nr:acylneuraminate cytidylyltransferase family protein [Chromatiales bacterium]